MRIMNGRMLFIENRLNSWKGSDMEQFDVLIKKDGIS